MPARLHAVIVAKSGATARALLLQTIAAVGEQSRRPDAITLVYCGDPITVYESPAVAATVESVIEARSTTSFAEAVALAQPRVAEGSAVWLLTHDTVPDRNALAGLAGALERSPSAAVAAPKLVRDQNERAIVSFGVSMTRLGRSVELAAGELDQGQHDGADEALGADIRGILIRGEVREHLAIDEALDGADEGLDLGVRSRLGGGRVVLVADARLRVSEDGPAALPRRVSRRAYVTRLAQLHRRLAYAPPIGVPLHWISFLPLALWRTIGHLIGKRPAAVIPEWAAAATAMVRPGAVARSRGRIRAFRTAGWASIAPLRVIGGELRRRLDDGHGSEHGALSELNFFSGGGAWAVLAALIVSVASFTSLLAWPALAGGGLLPLRDTVGALWNDALWGLRGVGAGALGPPDPFAAVLAVLGSLWPGAPSFALVLLWILALPLAVLGGWFAATRVTDRPGLRIFVATAWALAPTFLVALVEGRPAAVLVHLLLPWLFHSAVVAHRSWGAAGAGSVVLAAVVACAPVLTPGIVVLWLLAVVIVFSQRSLHGAVRVIWLLVPAFVLLLPLVSWRLQNGDLVALLADPAVVWEGPQAQADSVGRLALATGFPDTAAAGWLKLAGPGAAALMPLLLAPLAVLALAAALAPRWRVGVVLLFVTLVGLATAFLSVGIAVSLVQGQPVAIWPGTALSLAWVGVVGASAVTLDTLILLPRLRAIGALVTAGALALCAVPGLTAFHADRSVLTPGSTSTLPALVETMLRGQYDTATLVITPLDDDRLQTRVVWGPSETLGSETTMLSTAGSESSAEIGALAVDLISRRDFDAAGALVDRGIRFVLLKDTDAGRALSLEAANALDERAGFVKAGELWRVGDDLDVSRDGLTGAQQGVSRGIGLAQLMAFLIALLLAVPTRASRRAARSISRIVGRVPEEPALPVRSHARAADEVDRAPDDAPAPEQADAKDDGEVQR